MFLRKVAAGRVLPSRRVPAERSAASVTATAFAVVFFLLSFVVPSRGQGKNILNFDANISPSAEAFAMIRYGDVQPDLYTGSMSYSVPVFTYEDADFQIPVSLEYSYDGYRPSSPSGSVGLGWTLMAGGVITRDVRGVPDEQYNCGDNSYGTGGWCYTIENRQTLDTLHYYRPGPFPILGTNLSLCGLDLFGAVACFKPSEASYWTQTVTASYEASPDLFHFTVDGASGDFVLDIEGNSHVFGNDVPSDLFTVTIYPVTYYSPTSAPRIEMTRKDGYRFVFGGDLSHTEFGRNSGNDIGTDDLDLCFTAFRLNEIIAPNGRTVKFKYASQPQCWQSATADVSQKITTTMTISLGGMDLEEHPYSHFYFPLEEIDVDGDAVVKMTYSVKVYDEYGSGRYERTANDATWDVSQIGLTQDPSARRLSLVRVLDQNGGAVKTVSLSHSYTSASGAAPKMFLRSVTDSSDGRTEFYYYKGSSSDKYPYCDTKGVDHWGYWNGKQNAHTVQGIIPVLTTTQQDTTLYNLSSTNRDADGQYSRYGTLTKIVYPTGGESLIEYEPHEAPPLVLDETDSGLFMRSNSYNVVPGGVRVKQTVAVDGARRDTTRYLYTMPDTPGTGSGELLFMPRYCAQEPFTIQLPNDSARNGYAIGFSAQSGIEQMSGAHVGYKWVTEVHPDGSRTEYGFVPHSEAQDVKTQLNLSSVVYGQSSDYIFCGPDEYGHLSRYLSRHHDGSMLRGRLSSKKEYTAGGTLLDELTSRYGLTLTYEVSIGENVVSALVKNTVNCNSVALMETVHREYLEGGFVQTRTTYSYDGTMRKVAEKTITDNSGDGYASYYKYNGRGWTSDITETSFRGSLQVITGRTAYAYNSDNASFPARNPRPSAVTEYVMNEPVVVPSDTSVWSVDMLTADGTNRIRTTNISYYDNYFLKRITLPGGRFTEYEWDAQGRAITGKTVNAATNKWTYGWKDLVGVTSITEPSGIVSQYRYDSKNRLLREVDANGHIVRDYGYRLESDGAANETVTVNDSISVGGTNYILTKTYVHPVAESDPEVLPEGVNPGEEYVTDVEYYDGLGFPCAKASVNAAGAGRHVVTLFERDSLGRMDAKEYLPYVKEGANVVWNGLSPAKTRQLAYWTGEYGAGGARAYRENRYESSPAGRLLWSRKPGYEFVLADKKTESGIRLNGASDHILKMNYNVNTGTYTTSLPFSVSGEYIASSLRAEETIDEDGQIRIVYSDALGKTVCSRTFPSQTDTLDTYYVYDLHDRVVCVIQPEGSAVLKTVPYNLAGAEPYCLQYRYDGKGNILRRKVPGGCWEDRYYDSRDREIAMTDERLLENGLFLWVKYDNLDHRINETYVKRQGVSASAMRGALQYGTMIFEYAPAADKIPVLERQYYTSGYSLPSGMRFLGYIGFVSSSDIKSPEGFLAYEKVYETPDLDGETRSVQCYVERSYGYDSKGRLTVIKEKDENRIQDICMTICRAYDHLGNVVREQEMHGPEAEAPMGNLYTWKEYDDRGRLTGITRKMDSHTLSSAEYAYDDMGRLEERTVTGSTGLAVGRQTYTYNMQGQESGSAALIGTDEVFRENLYYYEPGSSSPYTRWNGNLSEYVSRQGGVYTRRDRYTYDGASRLTGRVSATYDGATQVSPSFIENYAYNGDGSISLLSRGQGTPVPVRSFQYSGMRLTGVTGSDGGASYTYDMRGNRTSDSRRGLEISYNMLNLPSEVHKTDSTDSARFIYLSDGTKLKTIEGDGHTVRYRGSLVMKLSTESSEESIAGAVWSEGLTELTGSWLNGWTSTDVWYVRDYLGNVRGKYDLTTAFPVNNATSRELSRADYTPYGERIDMSTVPGSLSFGTAWDDLHRRHFGGKEEVGDGGLDLLDFGARYYDPYSFSWTSVDPMGDETPGYSSFVYCAGNPVCLVDPSGLMYTDYYDLNGKLMEHVEDGSINKYFILDGKPGAERAKSDGTLFPVPTKETLKKMEEVFEATEEDGLERGFQVDVEGNPGDVGVGTEEEIHTIPFVFSKTGQYVAYDVHTHPRPSEGKESIHPSGVDQQNLVGAYPNVVLGYKWEKDQSQGFGAVSTIGGERAQVLCRYITFHYGNESTNYNLRFDSFSASVNRIYRNEKRLRKK